jgi:hypothetical protein
VSWVAYADESARFGGSEVPGCYVIAALVVAEADAAELRQVMAPLAHRPKGFHWTEANKKRRWDAVTTVASAPALHVVTVAAPLDHSRQERARRACLERLLFELEVAGVRDVWLERRTPSLNRKDQQAVGGFLARRIIRDIRVRHANPATEPLLWVPDIVAGAVGLEAMGVTTEYWDALEPQVERHEVDLSRP